MYPSKIFSIDLFTDGYNSLIVSAIKSIILKMQKLLMKYYKAEYYITKGKAELINVNSFFLSLVVFCNLKHLFSFL
jgi:hypothetical protein